MYKLIEGISKSYKSKITNLDNKLAENELMVISLSKVKTQLHIARGATGSIDPRLPVDPCLLADTHLPSDCMEEDQDDDDQEDEEGVGSFFSSSNKEEEDDGDDDASKEEDEEDVEE